MQDAFYDRTYDDLEDEDRRRLDDSIVHATVLRQEHPAGSQNAVYSIFERLNTGGSPLQPQEIRVALYHGTFLQFIAGLNDDPNWRRLYGPISPRFKDQELLLRVFALYDNSENYSRPVKGFLNDYLGVHRQIGAEHAILLEDRFSVACELIAQHIGPRAFRPVRALNAAVLDALMVGMMRRLDRGSVIDTDKLAFAYADLVASRAFVEATTSSTAAEESVEQRLRSATEAFQSVN